MRAFPVFLVYQQPCEQQAIFQEREAIAEARGEARGEAKVLVEKASTVLTVLRARFKKVPKSVERSMRQVKDKVVLDSLAAHAATCGTS